VKKIKLRALTLLEVMMALSIFLILMGAVFYIYCISTRSWLKVRQQIEVKDSAQVTFIRIQREIRGSAADSVTIIQYPDPNNDAISFLSSYNPTSGLTDYDDQGKMLWTRYVLFYLEDDPDIAALGYYKLLSREVDISNISDYATQTIDKLPYPPVSGSTTTYPMDSYIKGLVTPVSPYLSSARTISRNITSLKFNLSLKEIDINVNTGKPLKPSSPSSPASPEKLNITGVIVLRNSN